MTTKEDLNQMLAGNSAKPVYLVYDWFVDNRQIDWQSLFDLGLGRINHASLINIERPHLEVTETLSDNNGQLRKDIKWITDIGELHEFYVDGWKQEHLIKTANDYRIMQRALEDSVFQPTDTFFDNSEDTVGDNGITIGQIGHFGELGHTRTPFQVVQIDLAGLECFSIDIALKTPELLDLLEMMNEQMVEIFNAILKTKAVYIKLWENLSIETMGPILYKEYLVPLYKRLFGVLEGSGKNLVVHYDGRLKIIADEIAALPFDGLDSITPPPEGDLTIRQARDYWPDKFLWLHPTLSWDDLPDDQLAEKIRQVAQEARMHRFCFQLSEEVPPNWQRTVPLILETLKQLQPD